MTRRMIDSAMWSNENFAALPAMARLLQIGIINHADDQGRMKANPLYLRSQIFPYEDLAIKDIEKWLGLIVGNGTIAIYSVDGKTYLQLLNWWQYQTAPFAAPSEYPKPPGWKDRIRRTHTKNVIVTYNWLLVNGTLAPDTCDEHGRPLSPECSGDGSGDNSPECSGDGSGDNSPDGSGRRVNRNIEIEIESESEKEGESAQAPAPAPAPVPPPIIAFSEILGGKLRRSEKLTELQTRAITSTVTDLELWRYTLQWWDLKGHRPTNIEDMLDVYRKGGPNHANGAGDRHDRNGRRAREPDSNRDEPTPEQTEAFRAEKRRLKAEREAKRAIQSH